MTGLLAAAPLKPRFYLNNGIAGITATFSKLITALKAAGTQGLVASERTINLGSVRLRVIPPPPSMPKTDQNLNSVGLLIEYGGFRSPLTGDSETAETQGWLKSTPRPRWGRSTCTRAFTTGRATATTPPGSRRCGRRM
ncbi:hypothetical protein [Deinococcus apachensis]|uniref:hypothetical protein n=1 Tax=Deinococcus apachensis TaxID=309886 RepID=UPI0003A5EA8F|nr:hypothetical protein [Deinococcus apachensis]